jgi:uridine kinase
MPEWNSEKAALADTLARLARESERPLIVAIDGRSGSGKSTLAAALSGTLDAAVIEGDDFYAGGTVLRADSPASRATVCIDWKRQRPVLQALRAGQEAQWHPFDWDAFDGSLGATAIRLGPRAVIILEGTYSARPELADLVDLRVLVTVPDVERHARLMAREGNIGPWERQWHVAEDHYFEAVMPPDAFDIILPG